MDTSKDSVGSAELFCKWSAEAWVISQKGLPGAQRQVLPYSRTALFGSTSFPDYGLGAGDVRKGREGDFMGRQGCIWLPERHATLNTVPSEAMP